MLDYHDSTKSHNARMRLFYTEEEGEDPALFREIEEDIFSVVDAKLYFEEKPEAETYEKIGEMHVVVFPVTEKLLSRENSRALSLIETAIASKIPVLPLIQTEKFYQAIDRAEEEYRQVCREGASDAKEAYYERLADQEKKKLSEFIAAYNRKFRGRQFLEKACRDKTALPFSEKLRSFLTSFLVDEKTEKQVKAAFDAHIFMSYRKADRGSMQEFMRLIHGQKEFENVAIWYDEFLTPGRDFNEVLREKLRQCDLMTLAVTPNLLQPGNYVHEEEYPYAVNHRVRVLPVELVRTDAEEYGRMYPDLPEPVPVARKEEIVSRLAETLSAVAWSDRMDDPVHTYLLGLAYLYGIDTNTDRDRARRMIFSAARGRIPDAAEKYASMCMYGETGVVSGEDALQFQQSAIGMRERAFAEEGTAGNASALGNSFRVMGDYLYALGSDPREDFLQARDWEYKALALSEDPEDVWTALLFLEALPDRFLLRKAEIRGAFDNGAYAVCWRNRLDVLKKLAAYHWKEYGIRTVLDGYAEFDDLAGRAWRTDLDMYQESFRQDERRWLEEVFPGEPDPAAAARLKALYFSAEDAESFRKGLELLEQYPEDEDFTAEKTGKYIDLLEKEGKWEELRAFLDGPAGRQRLKRETRLDRARCCEGLGRPEEAEKLYLEVLGEDSRALAEAERVYGRRSPEAAEKMNAAEDHLRCIRNRLPGVYEALEEAHPSRRAEFREKREKALRRMAEELERILEIRAERFEHARPRSEWVTQARIALGTVGALEQVYEKLGDREGLSRMDRIRGPYQYAADWRPKYSYEWDE